MAEQVIFVTGFPGFIGNRLVRALLEADPAARVVALVEQRMAARAEETARGIDPGRIEVLRGDIADRRLGLDSERYDRLAAEITSAHHLAAIYNLAVPLELAQRVNVEGTGNVVELCLRAERLERLHHVSTAYVAGWRRGVVYEHELSEGQRFKNHYESTKYQAEVWVRDAMDSVPTTVYRPAIVVGDSKTGETQKFDGPYYILRLISLALRRGLPIPQVGRAGAAFNVVPVDYVVDAVLAASRDELVTGRTLHLVDPEPVTAREVGELFSQAYAGRPPAYTLPAPLVELTLRFAPLRRAFSDTPRESIVYLNHSVRFDTRNASDLLERHGLRCPRFSEYAPTIVDFFRRHEDDPAYEPARA